MEKIYCNKCGSIKLKKIAYDKRVNRDDYKCQNCGKRTTKPATDVAKVIDNISKNQALNFKQTSIPLDFNGNKEKYKIEKGKVNGFCEGNISTREINEPVILKKFIEECNVDLTEWEIDKHQLTRWDMTTKNGDVYKNYHIKVFLKKISVTSSFVAFENYIDKLVKKIDSNKINFPTNVKIPNSKEKYMLEVSLFDMHFGKLAWYRETETDYNINIAKTIYIQAVIDFINKTKGYNVEKVILPFGQDFFNIDNEQGTTTKGTPQDMDGRLVKIIESGIEAITEAVNLCLTYFPNIEILFVPGNHDKNLSWSVCNMLKHYYRTVKNVSVDIEPTSRKFIHYGTNLIGFTHGNEEKMKNLPLLLADSCPQAWGKTTEHFWHLGHIHRRKEVVFTQTDSQGSVSIRYLPSLCGTDKWHYDKGFFTSKRAAECFLWGYKSGLTAIFNANYENLKL